MLYRVFYKKKALAQVCSNESDTKRKVGLPCNVIFHFSRTAVMMHTS